MARPLRLQFAGALNHVVSHGNDRQKLFTDDKDRERRVEWLRRTVERYGWKLHAFSLLRERDHLFVETPEPNLSAGMQYLNGCYTSYFNRRHERRGHLFEGRYRGHLIQPAGYFLKVSRYVHRLPLKERLTRNLRRYSWSSFPGYCDAADSLSWVYYQSVLSETSGANKRNAYAKLVLAGGREANKSPFVGASGGVLVGSEEFKSSVQQSIEVPSISEGLPQLKALAKRPPLSKVVNVVARQYRSDATLWASGTRHDTGARSVAAYVARDVFGYSAGKIAEALGYKSHGSVRSAVLRVTNQKLLSKEELDQIRSELESP